MKKIFLFLFFYFSFLLLSGQNEKKLFVYGGEISKAFIKYTAELTEKDKPRI